MKLKNIKIEKLFGLEQNNFDIELYPEENVTLLYGFNGVGKTSIIKLLDAAFTCNLRILFEFKISKLDLMFEDSSHIIVKRTLDSKIEEDCNNYRKYFWNLRFQSRRSKTDFYHPISYTEITSDNSVIEYKFRIAGEEKFKCSGGVSDYLDDESRDKLLPELKRKIQQNYALTGIIYANKDLNRTITLSKQTYRAFFDRERNDIPITLEYSYTQAKRLFDELDKYLKDYEEQYSKDKDNEENHSFSEVTVPYNERERFYINDAISVPDKIQTIQKLISDYPNGTQKDGLIELLLDIINNKLELLYKNLQFDGNSLFLENIYKNDKSVQLTKLSSGEKNIICLFTELLFKHEKNSIFFIDEPETSLHIEWQSHLVECLLELCKKFDLQVIIMTHSPEIVGEYDELTTKLIPERFQYERFFK